MAYLLLAGIGLICAIYTYRRAEDKARVLALLAAAAALIILADWIAFGWFHLYSYDTGLPLSDRVNDALGEFLGDIIFVPAFTVFLIRFLPVTAGLPAGTLAYCGLQGLFTWLGLYIDRGWEVWHTAISFPFYFGALYWYDKRLDQTDWTTGWQFKVVRICLMFDMVALYTLYLRAGALVHTRLHVMPTYIGNQSLGRFITYVPLIVPLGYWVGGRQGPVRWIRLGVALSVFLCANSLVTSIGFQEYRQYWSDTLDSVADTVTIMVGLLCQDAILRLARNKDRWRPPVMSRGWGRR